LTAKKVASGGKNESIDYVKEALLYSSEYFSESMPADDALKSCLKITIFTVILKQLS
jgi:hypothetical protein